MAGKKFYRLFKVAKELNVGTGILVEHLQGQGHDVDSSPNTKISAELHDLLLKEFASEKLMKEKAELLNEQRKLDVQTNLKGSTTTTHPEPKTETMDQDVVSADQLRSNLLATPRRRGETPPPPPPVEEATPPVSKEPEVPKEEASPKSEPVSEPREEPKTDPVQPEPKLEVATPPAEDDSSKNGLKVVGKIDLDDLKKGGKKAPKKKSPKKPTPTAKKAEEVVEEIKPVEPKAPLKEAEPDSPVVEKETPEPPVTKKESTAPLSEKPKTEPVSPPAEPKKESPKEESVSPPVEQTESPKEENAEEAKDPEVIMRAGDRTPELSGLKVLGKIELPGMKPKKKAEDANKDKKASEGSSGKDDEANKKKRRRRRKRKRNTSVKADVDNKNNQSANKGGSRGGKKEKPSEKEVDQSIRNTMAQMGRGASRSRQRLRRAKRDDAAHRRELQAQEEMEQERVLDLTEFITANEFAELIEVPVNEIIKKSFELGTMISINQRLDAELLSIIAEEYGFEANFVDITEHEFEFEDEEDAPENMETRNPIITVMGHVDHGKTTLLDYLRKANVTAGEAGGITQHIGAYEVKLESGRNATFLDTPGHEAFTAMRARGAKATDLAIIVVSADDAVMPQTKEAINHSQAADVPMIFAFNKMDKAGADPERIKGQLAEMNILVEDWGGKFQSQEISALKGQGVDDLLEKVILEADLLELKANPNRHAVGVVIEARLDKGRGNVVTLLVQNGTLKVGDEMVAGIHYGKVRALINQNGDRVKEAPPSMPVQVLGLNGIPTAGDKFHVFEDGGKARELAQKRTELYREQQFRQTKHITLDEITRRRAIGNFKELNIIIRGDVDGSVEALAGALLKLSTEEVQVNIITKGVGAISEADVNLAIASDAVILAFNVRPNAQARQLAEREEIDIRTYSVIYDAINDVKDALEGLLSPELKEEILGTAEVREVFKVSKVGMVAGCYSTSGKITKNDPVRIIRDGVVIYESKLTSLKRYKDDVKDVLNGYEFGCMVENYNDIKVGDHLESYRVNEVKRKLGA